MFRAYQARRVIAAVGVVPASAQARTTAAMSGVGPAPFTRAGMDTRRDEHRVDADASRAGDIGVQRVADGQDAAPLDAAECRQARLVGGGVGLAAVRGGAASALIGRRQRAGAGQQALAAHDRVVGIGAHHRQAAGQRRGEEVLVVGDGLGVVVEQAGVEDEGRPLERDRAKRHVPP